MSTQIEILKQAIKQMETYKPLDKQLLQQAFAQTVAEVVCFEDEETGAKMYKKLVKALGAAKTNRTIEFKNDVLTFVSADSGKRRIVTESGCHSTCDCGGNQTGYHKCLYLIAKRYCELLDEQRLSLTVFPVISKSQTAAAAEVKLKKSRANDVNVPYLKQSSDKPVERVGGIRIN